MPKATKTTAKKQPTLIKFAIVGHFDGDEPFVIIVEATDVEKAYKLAREEAEEDMRDNMSDDDEMPEFYIDAAVSGTNLKIH